MPSPQPNPDVIDMHQQVNNQNLLAIAQAIQQVVDDRQANNSVDLSKLASRMQRSLGAQQTVNSRALAPVVASLQGTVDAAQGVNSVALASLPRTVQMAATQVLPVAAPAPVVTAATSTTPPVYTDCLPLTPTTVDKLQAGAIAVVQQANPPGGFAIMTASEYQLIAMGSTGGIDLPLPSGYYNVPSGYTAQVDQATGKVTACPTVGPLPQPTPPPPINGTTQPPPVNGQPPPPVLWYCGTFPDGSKTAFQGTSPLNANVAAQYVNITGPYLDSATAANACQGIFTQPPPPEPPQYWCAYTVNENGTRNYMVVQAPTINDLIDQNLTYDSGPYDDINTASAACGGQGITQVPVYVCGASNVPLLPNWCHVNVCDEVDTISARTTGPTDFDLFRSLGLGTQKEVDLDNSWLGVFDKMGGLPSAFVQTAIQIGCNINALVNAANSDMQASSSAFLTVAVVGGILDLVEKWFGLNLGDVKQRFDYWLNYMSPTHIPSPDEADSLWQQGFITDKQWECWVKANNVCPEPHRLVAQSGLWHPGPDETERLFRIGSLNELQYIDSMEWNKITDEGTRALFRDLYTNYPGAGDIIRFMVRDVWDKTVVDAGQYDAEFPEKWQADAKYLGNIAGVSDDLARLYWRAHWQLPSTSQTYEMLHRLRLGRVAPNLVFSREDAIRLLGVNDNAPGYRDRLIAISYNPLPIRALRSLYDTGQMDEREVGERYQDMGYSPEDANLFSSQERTLHLRRLATQGQGYTTGWLSKAYSLGAVSDTFVKQEMVRLGYDQDTIDRLLTRATYQRTLDFGRAGERKAMAKAQQATLHAYQIGALDRDSTIAVLQQQGFTPASALVTINAIDLTVRTQLVAQSIQAIRRQVLVGALSIPQGLQQLVQAGVTLERANGYAAVWTLQLTPKRKTLARNDILKMIREGILTTDQARQRLINLGFTPDDVELLILETAYQTDQAELRAKTALDKQRQKAAAALMRETKRQETLANQTRKALCRKTPTGVLSRWFAGHLIDDQYVIDSLTCQGYTPEQRDKYLEEFRAARAKRDAKKATIAEEASSAVPQ